jgi:hypothetical protein
MAVRSEDKVRYRNFAVFVSLPHVCLEVVPFPQAVHFPSIELGDVSRSTDVTTDVFRFSCAVPIRQRFRFRKSFSPHVM